MKQRTHTETQRFTGELERLGPDGTDIMVLGVEAPGFDALSADQRRLVYYLYRAAIPGNEIAYEQSHRDALEIKQTLEQIYLHSEGLDEAVRDAVHDYLKYVWIHHGQYDHYTHTKFVPRLLTVDDFRAACEHAVANGATIPVGGGGSIDEMVTRLEPSIFDPDHEPIQTNQSDGVDIVAASAVNYYDPGVTLTDIEALGPEWRHRLNARFARRNGEVVPEAYQVGGCYGDALDVTCHFLSQAIPFAETPEQRRSIEKLIAYYQDGKEETFREHCIDWLAADSEIDYVNGFVESYLDPRGVIGHFGANVSFRAERGLIDAISDNAGYFEARMPWPDKYKRTEIGRPVANLVNVVIETGDSGPVSPAAYNLPNYNDIRRDHGSKNVILHNIENTWSREMLEQSAKEFYLSEYQANVLAWARSVVRPLEVYMHEIIGHGSGQPDKSLKADPRATLGRSYTALEECRADLVALYHMSDPKLVEIGAFTAAQQQMIVETTYITYTQGWLGRIDRVPGLQVREAHNRGHHCILNYLLDGGDDGMDFGLEVIKQSGNFYVRLNNAERVHAGLGELLSKVQVIKSTGDAAAAEALFERYGTALNAEWKENIAERKARLKSPKTKAFVFPNLVPVIKDGELVDAELRHDEDLTAQQLRFSRIAMSRELNTK